MMSSVDVEVRKRTMWAIYCQHIKASTTYGRPPMICLNDLGESIYTQIATNCNQADRLT